MAITFGVATVTGINGAAGLSGNGTFDVPLPTSWAAGQLALLLSYTDQGSIAVTTPATGWSEVSGSPWGSATPKMHCFYRFLEAGDGTVTLTVSGSTGTLGSCGAIATYSGVDTSTPVEVVGTASVGTGTPMTAAQISTLTDGAWAIGLCSRGDNELADTQTFGGSATGVTERLDCGSNVGDDSAVSMYSKEIASYGATGNGSAATSATDPWISVIIALKPSVAAADETVAVSDPIKTEESGSAAVSAQTTLTPSKIDYVQIGEDRSISVSAQVDDNATPAAESIPILEQIQMLSILCIDLTH